MMIYQLSEQIPLSIFYVKASNGAPETGKIVTVQVFDASTGLDLIASQNLIETGVTGFYKYIWTHGQTVPKTCLAVYRDGSTVISSNDFRIVDVVKNLTDTIDFGDGRAV